MTKLDNFSCNCDINTFYVKIQNEEVVPKSILKEKRLAGKLPITVAKDLGFHLSKNYCSISSSELYSHRILAISNAIMTNIL